MSTNAEEERPVRLEVRAVSKRFGGIRAVDAVSFQLAGGEIRGIIGPNGAGKTTLFDIIAGAQRATSGSIHLNGADISTTSGARRSRLGIRRTFQRQQPIGWLTVEENVLVASEWRGGGGGMLGDLFGLPARRKLEQGRRDRARSVLDLCGLLAEKDRQATNLSIGQARRLELARAVVDEPQLLLLDEPTSGLEEAEVEVFAHIVSDIRDRTGCSVLLVEHDVPFVLGLCDQVMVMDLGQVIATGSPDEVSRDVNVRDAYLG